MKPIPEKQTLSDADIRSAPNRTRRSLLASLGLGAGIAAIGMARGTRPARAQSDPENRGKRCAYRDGDAGDIIRRACGETDTD